jgi:thiol-disulfide isomerase/thioredoxin
VADQDLPAPQPASKQHSAIPSWVLVASAAALVIGLSFAGQKKARDLPAPTVTLKLLGGGTKSLQPGKVTLVDFWATWCGPCRKTMPRVQQVYTDYAPRGLDLLSIAEDDPAPDRDAMVREYLQQNGYSFPVTLDDSLGGVEKQWGVEVLPTMLLVGKDGSVVWRHRGVLSSSDESGLRLLIERSLQ